jgi:hypothetical protein
MTDPASSEPRARRLPSPGVILALVSVLVLLLVGLAAVLGGAMGGAKGAFVGALVACGGIAMMTLVLRILALGVAARKQAATKDQASR